MKRFLSILLAAALTVSMIGCSEGSSADTDQESSVEEVSSKPEMGSINMKDFSGLIVDNSLKPPIKTNDTQSSKTETNKTYNVQDADYNNGKYTGQVVGNYPQGCGQFVVSDNQWLTCATWKKGVPDGPVNHYRKKNNTIIINDGKMKDGVYQGEQETIYSKYTDNTCQKLDSITYIASNVVDGKMNGDAVVCVIDNDGKIGFASGKAKDNEMTGDWKYYITDGEKILEEGTISDVKKQNGLLSKLGNVLKGIGKIAKKAFTKIKDSIGNVINKFKGLPAEQKNRITKIGKYLGGKFADKLFEDKQLEQQYKLKHPVKAACKEFYNGIKDVYEGVEAFVG